MRMLLMFHHLNKWYYKFLDDAVYQVKLVAFIVEILRKTCLVLSIELCKLYKMHQILLGKFNARCKKSIH